jgi:hypothetical protein
VSGPPRTYVEAKLLAEKVLRSVQVLTGIDELSSPSISLAAGSMAALMSGSSSSASGSSGVSAQQIFAAKSVRLAHAASTRAEASGAAMPAPRNRKVRTKQEAHAD